jgi:Amt family ammonium transporter
MTPEITPPEVQTNLNVVWTLIAGILVFTMQAGFALVETGFTRAKNAANIMMKNLMDFAAGSLAFYVLGAALMFGATKAAGWFGWGGLGMPSLATGEGVWDWTFLFFQTMFCATAATIVSGAMAERTKFSNYLIYSVLISAIIYPISGHWGWGGGWLAELGFHDFAGSTLVHACGGMLALAGAMALGPRIGKYDRAKRSRAIPGHNLALCALGVFCLWMGWFGFNPCSELSITGESAIHTAHVFITTNMAAATGGLAALAYTWLVDGKPSLSMVCNGILAGLVGITAGCDCVDVWAAAVIGLVTSAIMCYSVSFIDKKLRIDDPVGAISVHGVGGIVGTILTGVFVNPALNGTETTVGIQTLGAVAVCAWAFVMGLVVFYGIKYTLGLRCDKRIEEEGLDVYEHGEACYN